jgi:hypothetical protein
VRRDTVGGREDIRCIDGCGARSRGIGILGAAEWAIREQRQMRVKQNEMQSVESNLGMYAKDAMEETPGEVVGGGASKGHGTNI